MGKGRGTLLNGALLQHPKTYTRRVSPACHGDVARCLTTYSDPVPDVQRKTLAEDAGAGASARSSLLGEIYF